MLEQNKNITSCIESISTVARGIGFGAMVLGAVLSMAELAEKESSALFANVQLRPAYAYATQLSGQQPEIRRNGGREEIRHSSATYGPSERTQRIAGSV